MQNYTQGEIQNQQKNESPNLELRHPVLDDSFKYSSLGKPIWSVKYS